MSGQQAEDPVVSSLIAALTQAAVDMYMARERMSQLKARLREHGLDPKELEPRCYVMMPESIQALVEKFG